MKRVTQEEHVKDNNSLGASIFGDDFVMDEMQFAKEQKDGIFGGGFFVDRNFGKNEYEATVEALANGGQVTLYHTLRVALAYTFGTFGAEVNLEKAKGMVEPLIAVLEKATPPGEKTNDNEHFMSWLNSIGMAQVALGTIYVYLGEYIKAAYHFLRGLKTQCVQLNAPYTDFITHVISKLDDIEKDTEQRNGTGFNPDKPMGAINIKESQVCLDAQMAMEIIPALEGDDKEVIVAHNKAYGMRGHLERRGSINMVDIYDTYIIGKDYSLKKISFFFNGYKGLPFGRQQIRLPKGFHINPVNPQIQRYEILSAEDADAANTKVDIEDVRILIPLNTEKKKTSTTETKQTTKQSRRNSTGMRIHKTFGLDLGTTNSTVSVFRNGRSFCAEDAKQKGIPSIVGKRGTTFLVGAAAKNNVGLEKLRSVKRQMGKDIVLTLGDVEYKPEEISAEIIRFCAGLLNAQADVPKDTVYDRIVITVPAYFSVAQKDATRKAGELASLEVVMLLEEPTAAAINYTVKNNIQNGVFMVYDLGGGTFDVSIIEKIDSIPVVLATAGNNFLGGDNFDSLLAHYFIEVLNNELGYDIKLDLKNSADEHKFKALLLAAENVKKNLSQSETFTINYYDVFKDNSSVDLVIEDFPRKKFEELIKDKIIIDTVTECEKALAAFTASGRTLGEIDAILLVGGSSKIPCVIKALEKQFVKTGKIKKIVTDEPDLAVGLGAGIVAAAQGTVLEDTEIDIKVEVNAPYLHDGGLNISGKVISGKIDEIGIIAGGKEIKTTVSEKGEFSVDIDTAMDFEYKFYQNGQAVSGAGVEADGTNLIAPTPVQNETIRIEIVDLERQEIEDFPLVGKGEALPCNATHYFKINEHSREEIVLPVKEGYREIFKFVINVPDGTPIGSRITVTTNIDILGKIDLQVALNNKPLKGEVIRSEVVDIGITPDMVRDNFYDRLSNVKADKEKDGFVERQENIERELDEARNNNETSHYTDVLGKYETLVSEMPREISDLTEADFDAIGEELKALAAGQENFNVSKIDDEVYFGKRALARKDIMQAKERYENLKGMRSALKITSQPKLLLAIMLQQTLNIIQDAERLSASISDSYLRGQIKKEAESVQLFLNTLNLKDNMTNADAKDMSARIMAQTNRLFALLEQTGVKEIKGKLDQFKGRVSKD